MHYLSQCWPDSLTHICGARGIFYYSPITVNVIWCGFEFNPGKLTDIGEIVIIHIFVWLIGSISFFSKYAKFDTLRPIKYTYGSVVFCSVCTVCLSRLIWFRCLYSLWVLNQSASGRCHTDFKRIIFKLFIQNSNLNISVKLFAGQCHMSSLMKIQH